MYILTLTFVRRVMMNFSQLLLLLNNDNNFKIYEFFYE